MTVPLTAYVAEFIAGTAYGDIPDEVLALGKKSILEGFGLALSGNHAGSGALFRAHLSSLGVGTVQCLVIGPGRPLAPRLRPFRHGASA